jgi:hypothetical protein
LIHLLSRLRLNALTSESFSAHAQSLINPPAMVSGAVAREPISSY